VRTFPSRPRVAAVAALALSSGVAVVGVSQPTEAAPAGACTLAVSREPVALTQLARGATLRSLVARVTDPVGGQRAQRARARVTVLPPGSTPVVLGAGLGVREGIGTAVRTQQPRALAAVNGDFFLEPTIRGKTVPVPRGPVVSAGSVVRGTVEWSRVVGVTAAAKPYVGSLAIRGVVRAGGALVTPVVSVNGPRATPGGVTVYTTAWTQTSATPRPAGAAEWVVDDNGRLTQIRNRRTNDTLRGSPVQPGTQVLAFSRDTASLASGVLPGERVTWSVFQQTRPRVVLQTAIGRGLRIVADGAATPRPCAAYQSSQRPRTVLGWDADGNWRIVTVPGTEFTPEAYRIGGFGVAQVGALAQRLGLVQAVTLDGGGSTTLYTRTGRTWTRRDLWRVRGGTYERPVVNGLAFVQPGVTPR
jgi:hypothetical protein